MRVRGSEGAGRGGEWAHHESQRERGAGRRDAVSTRGGEESRAGGEQGGEESREGRRAGRGGEQGGAGRREAVSTRGGEESGAGRGAERLQASKGQSLLSSGLQTLSHESQGLSPPTCSASAMTVMQPTSLRLASCAPDTAPSPLCRQGNRSTTAGPKSGSSCFSDTAQEGLPSPQG